MPRLATDDRRRSIAEAALGLIADHGIAALTVASLARSLDITPGALYRHFKSRDAILIEAAKHARDLLDKDLVMEVEEPLARLHRFMEVRTGTVRQHAGLVCLVTSEQLAKALPQEAREHLLGAINTSREFLFQVVEEGQGQGSIRTDIPTEDVVMVAMGTMQLLALRSAGWGGGVPPDSIGTVKESLMILLRPSVNVAE